MSVTKGAAHITDVGYFNIDLRKHILSSVKNLTDNIIPKTSLFVKKSLRYFYYFAILISISPVEVTILHLPPASGSGRSTSPVEVL